MSPLTAPLKVELFSGTVIYAATFRTEKARERERDVISEPLAWNLIFLGGKSCGDYALAPPQERSIELNRTAFS
jgi:hypothetical protein